MRPGIVLAAVLALFAAAALSRPRAEPAPVRPAPPPPAPPAVAPIPDPRGLPSITPATLKSRLEASEDLLLVFVGTEAFFQARRIPRARCVPYGELRAVFDSIDRSREIVLYCGCCGGAAEGVSGLALRQLLALGFRKASHLAGHYAAWRDAGYAVDGTDPVAGDDRSNEAQRKQLGAFTEEADRRRRELEAALRAEPDPSRLQELDRQIELDGLLLKRRLAEESGDADRVADVDRILRGKSGR